MSNQVKFRGGNKREYILLLLVFFSLLYFVYPLYGEPSMFIYGICLCGYLVGGRLFFSIKRKTNYFDFDVLFIILYGLVSYSTTPFYYNEVLYRGLFIGYMFDVNYVNQGNVISTIGIIAYCYGSSRSFRLRSTFKSQAIIKTKGLSLLLLLLTFLFIVMGGRAYSQSAYREGVGGHSALIPYILLLLTYVSIVILTTEFFNKKYHQGYSVNLLSIFSIGIVFIILLMGGSRSDASYIALPVIAVYTLLFFPMKLKYTMVFLFLGIIVMWFIGSVRTGEGFSGIANPILALTDLTVPSRSTYAAYEYVASKGLSFGSSFVGLFSVIPFLSGYTGLTEGSAELLTNYFLDNNPNYPSIGLGTTIIADIYIAFGYVGVIVIMYILGSFVSKSLTKAYKLDYFSLITYAALMSVSVFIVRGSCTLPVRPVLWCWVIAFFNYKLQQSKKNEYTIF